MKVITCYSFGFLTSFYFTLLNLSHFISADDVVLDTKNGSLFGWKIADTWFQYYNYGIDIECDDDSKILVPEDFELSEFESAEGVWVVANQFPPDFEFSVPSFNFSASNLFFDVITVTAYLHGNSALHIFTSFNQHVVFRNNVPGDYTWRMFTVTLNVSTFNFQVVMEVEQQGDFVLLDKITAILTPPATMPPTTTTTTPNSSETTTVPSTTEAISLTSSVDELMSTSVSTLTDATGASTIYAKTEDTTTTEENLSTTFIITPTSETTTFASTEDVTLKQSTITDYNLTTDYSTNSSGETTPFANTEDTTVKELTNPDEKTTIFSTEESPTEPGGSNYPTNPSTINTPSNTDDTPESTFVTTTHFSISTAADVTEEELTSKSDSDSPTTTTIVTTTENVGNSNHEQNIIIYSTVIAIFHIFRS